MFEKAWGDTPGSPPSRGAGLAIYICYLAFFISGITVLIGVILAYVMRGETESYIETHYRFQIRTFWLLIAYVALFLILDIFVLAWLGRDSLLVLGLVALGLCTIWYLVRCVAGLVWLCRRQPVPNSGSLLFGTDGT